MTGAKVIAMYESKNQPLLSRPGFIWRLATHVAGAFVFTVASLIIGVAAYIHFEEHSWDQALMNTALMLGGFGPIDTPHTVGGRLFIGAYAIYIGLVFVAAVGIILAPIAHRFLHRFHADGASRRN